MADTEGYTFDGDSAQRIADAVRKVERPESLDLRGTQQRDPNGQAKETCWARLTSYAAGKWGWSEVVRQNDGTYATLTYGLTGTTSDRPAIEITGDTTTAVGSHVLLRRIHQLDNSNNTVGDVWEFTATISGIDVVDCDDAPDHVKSITVGGGLQYAGGTISTNLVAGEGITLTADESDCSVTISADTTGCATTDPHSIGSTSLDVTALTDDYNLAETGQVTVTKLYRLGWDTSASAGGMVFCAFYRDELYDACGALVLISAETKVEITSLTDCT